MLGKNILRYDTKSTIYKRKKLISWASSKFKLFVLKRHCYENESHDLDWEKILINHTIDKEFLLRIRTLIT